MDTTSILSVWTEAYNIYGGRRLRLGPFLSATLHDDPSWLCFHLARYKAASRLRPPCCDVLELGCGEGLGTAILAQGATKCTAVDGNAEAVAAARELDLPVEFIADDFLGKRYGIYRACVSLDVIEHIPRSSEDLFMTTILNNLSDDGVCIIGTPNETSSKYASEVSRKTHINLYDAVRLRSLLSCHFQNVCLFGMNDEMLHTGYAAMCHYLLGVGFGKIA